MKKHILLLVCALYSLLLPAQETDANQIDVNISTNNESWYASPWLWIVGAALFILLLVALTRDRKSS